MGPRWRLRASLGRDGREWIRETRGGFVSRGDVPVKLFRGVNRPGEFFFCGTCMEMEEKDRTTRHLVSVSKGEGYGIHGSKSL